MKSFLVFFFMLFFSTAYSQLDSDATLGLPSGTTAEINSIPVGTLQEGVLVFDNQKKKVFKFDGTSWRELLVAPVVNALTGNYTLTLTDNLTILTFNSATDITLTIPAGLPIGFNVSLYQIGIGKVTIAGVGGVSVRNRLSRFRTAGIDAGVGIVCTATNIFHVTGDLKQN